MAFTSNSEFLHEIEQSKRSYCSFTTEREDYDIAAYELPASAPEGTVVRLATWDHIPTTDDKKAKSRALAVKGQDKVRTNFPPFAHFEYRDGAWVEIARSHWVGSLSNGYFSVDHGAPTRRLVELWMMLTTGYALRPNFRHYSYRDEMEATALLQLCQGGLIFDAMRSDKPFSYYLQTVHNAFLKVLKAEKVAADIRDDLLQDAGMMPSHTRQAQASAEPKPKGKPGRKPKAKAKNNTNGTEPTLGDEL